MKKTALIAAVLMCLMACGADAAKYVSRAAQPDTNNVASITQNFTEFAVPVLIYTELTGTTTNAVTVTYAPSLATNATDYGTSYVVGSFSTVGGSEAPLVLNEPQDTNSVGDVVLNRGDALTLTGAGGTDNTNVLYRVLFKVE